MLHCISEINNTQIDNANGIDAVMSIYNSTEFSDNYLKTLGSLQQVFKLFLKNSWNVIN